MSRQRSTDVNLESEGGSHGQESGDQVRRALEPVWRPRASYDIESAVVYLGEVMGRPHAAKALYEDVVAKVELLCDFPEMGKRFTDSILKKAEYRSFLVGQYRIFYTYDDVVLTVWRVIHTRRDIDDYSLVDLLD